MFFDQSRLLYVPFAAILTQEGSIFNSFLILFAESAAEIPQRLKAAFFNSAVGVLQTLVVALGAGMLDLLLEEAMGTLGVFMRA